MGIRPCPPFNPDVPCDCSSTFTVNQTATINIFLVGRVTGTLILNGSICPNCDNNLSNFTFSFVDTDLSDGNQSFTFVPTSIEPRGCRIEILDSVEYLIQDNSIVGIFTRVGQPPTLVFGTISLAESTTPGLQDRVIFELFSINGVRLADGDILVPDNAVTVTDCP